jgi:CRISPR-associated endonuclease Cas2
MEPLRPVVDILALEVVGSSCELSRQQRSKLRGVLLRTVYLGTKTEYTAYRKRLVALGYSLVQPEAYIRAVPSRKTAARCLREHEEHVPTTGSICAFCMTERQFAGVRYLVGGMDYQEERVGVRTMVEL